MSGGIIAGGHLESARITETELAARNRRADFPASQRVARSRRPRPSSTGTAREGGGALVEAAAECPLEITGLLLMI